MTLCCCPCHARLTRRETRALVWAALHGQPLATVAATYGVTVTQARELIAALCYAANPGLYDAHREEQATGATLRTLRRHRAAFGFGEGA